jgi:OOP family OmpA-OmpF porin
MSVKVLAAAAALAAAFSAARASAPGDAVGYVLSADGRPVVDPFGDCWHTNEWQRGMHFANCEPKARRAAAVSGATARAAPRHAPAAKAALVAAKPAPRPAAPLRLSADTLFPFDSDVLTAQGRSILDGLDKRIANAGYRFVDISGHADRLGTPSYNRRLSERRAEAVRDYLVEHGIDAHRIRARGLGSANPVTSSARCAGLPRKRLIECLQPDRYAEVTVVGTVHTASAR